MKSITFEAKTVSQQISEYGYDESSTIFSVPGPYGGEHDVREKGVRISFPQLEQLSAVTEKTVTAHVYMDASGNTYTSGADYTWLPYVFWALNDADSPSLRALPSTTTDGAKSGAEGWVEFALGDRPYHVLQLFQEGYLPEGSIHYAYTWPFRVYGKGSAFPPYVTVYAEEGAPVTTPLSPAGYVSRADAITFAWSTVYPNWPLEDPVQSSAELQWRDGDGEIQNIAISGGAKDYTMPEDTLPLSNTLQWRVVVQTAEGESVSEWKAIRTADVDAVVTGISPSGAFVDGSDVIRLTWQYDIATGTEQTAYDVQYKAGSGNWTDLQSESTVNHYADIPPNTLPSGSVQWRVRAYNQSSLASPWSESLTIVVIAAPPAPELSVNVASPRPEISWTVNDQQAYQVQMGDYDSSLVFGIAKSFKCPVYLADGRTTIAVRVINAYNLWSPWASMDIDIVNVPGDTAPALIVYGGRDAQLIWDPVHGAVGYWVYRNGVKIAETDALRYIDRYAIGETIYFVRAVYADDNYTDSVAVQTVLAVKYPVITALDGEWVELRYTSESLPYIQSSLEQSVSFMTCSGAVYPVPEVAPHKQRTYSINAAFPRGGDVDNFEALVGREICVKDQYGNLIHGIMSAVSRQENIFYTVCTATVTQVEGDL